MKAIIVLIAALAAGAASAEPTVCTNAGLTRSVEVAYLTPGQSVPCEVMYDKPTEGASERPWRAEAEAGYCEARAAELIEKLRGWGWSCN